MHVTRRSGRWLPVRIDDFQKWHRLPRRLGIFRLFRQVTTINRVLRRLTDGLPACPDPRETAAR
jgi:hypothetical protein